MARKNQLLKYPIITAGAMTGTSTLTSAVTNITYLDNIGLQFDWTSSPVGTFAVQVSTNYYQDDQGNVTNAGTWVPLTFTYWNGTINVTATSIPTSVGTPIYLDLALLSAPWIRVQYTNSSSTGTLTAVITGKQAGG
jgi:hypothetical protein